MTRIRTSTHQHHETALSAPVVVLASGRCELSPSASDIERWAAYASGFGELAPWESPQDVIGLLVAAVGRNAHALPMSLSSAAKQAAEDAEAVARALESAADEATGAAHELRELARGARA